MADAYRPPDHSVAEHEQHNSLTTRPRENGSESHHSQRLVLNEAQSSVGGVSQTPTEVDTQSQLHNTTSSLNANNISRPASQQSSNQDRASYAPDKHCAPSSSPPDMEVVGLAPSLSTDHQKAYDECPLKCPVNKESMAELETNRIVNNPKLRNDVNYDRELHFRPNLDGQYGKQKMQDNQRYWSAVGYELQLIEGLLRQRADPACQHDDTYFQKELIAKKKRLPYVFEAVRDILISLVPETDQQRIRERLDVDFLMQQIDNGVLDLPDLATWLGKVITTHCAPMRDSQVERMTKTVIEASALQETGRLTDGLRQLIDIMEAMKLDVANHQIRHIRTHLIAGTVQFQRRYNAHRRRAGKVDVDKSRKRFETRDDLWPPSMLDSFCCALLEDISSSEPDVVPTLYLDRDRLLGLSVEVHNYLCREICHEVLRFFTSGHSSDAWHMLQPYLMTINGSHNQFFENIDNIAAQITHIVTACTNQSETAACEINLRATALIHSSLLLESDAWSAHRHILLNRILPKLLESVHRHRDMTALQLQDALVPVPPSTLPCRANGFGAVLEPARTPVAFDPDHTLIRKLTHIIVIHWQVWSDVYESSGAPQTMPVANISSSPRTGASTLCEGVRGAGVPAQPYAEGTAQ